MLVDVHCHLNHSYFKSQIDAVIQRAKEAGVSKIIANGTNPVTNREVLELASKYNIVECALGAYPGDALNVPADPNEDEGLARAVGFDLDAELDFIRQNSAKIVALGEVGMDFKY